LGGGGGRRVGFGRFNRRYGGTVPFFQCFTVFIGGGVERFAPVLMVMERGDATGAWYWKGLPTTTLAFERQKSAPRHKSSKEHVTVMCCGNVSGNHKLEVIGKAIKTMIVQGYQSKLHSCPLL
jgi:hypothetical protein